MRNEHKKSSIYGILLLVAGTQVLFAQTVEFPLFFKNLSPGASTERKFTVSAHPDGTDSLDTQLGETEIPSIPLPGGIFYVWSVAPISEPLWLSPKEVRKLRIGEKHLEIYDIRINWNGGILEISWPYPIPSFIDSIYVVDGKSDYPDNIISEKIQPGTMITTDNPAFDRFNIMVWYNAVQTSVEENDNIEVLRLWPNPATSEISIYSDLGTGNEVDILDINGRVVKNLVMASPLQTISISDLPSGIFIVRTRNTMGMTRSKMFARY
ncbi:MAG: T9SS type A sorting domain-containing protein [Ignavibacteria bacterium]|nr:T9SS type A sorting domain-containing protein [Ignavibacteria bacterium]